MKQPQPKVTDRASPTKPDLFVRAIFEDETGKALFTSNTVRLRPNQTFSIDYPEETLLTLLNSL